MVDIPSFESHVSHGMFVWFGVFRVTGFSRLQVVELVGRDNMIRRSNKLERMSSARLQMVMIRIILERIHTQEVP